jgi:hypothetical protein
LPSPPLGIVRRRNHHATRKGHVSILGYLSEVSRPTGSGCFLSLQDRRRELSKASSLSLVAAPIECEGKPCALVTTKLEHPGENWSFYIKCAELTVVEDGKPTLYSPITIRFRHPSRDTFELGPGEKTEYGTIVKGLPFGKPVIIEALFVLQ